MIIISIISKTRLRFNFFFCELLVKDGADVRCKFRSWASFDDQTFDWHLFSTSWKGPFTGGHSTIALAFNRCNRNPITIGKPTWEQRSCSGQKPVAMDWAGDVKMWKWDNDKNEFSNFHFPETRESNFKTTLCQSKTLISTYASQSSRRKLDEAPWEA